MRRGIIATLFMAAVAVTAACTYFDDDAWASAARAGEVRLAGRPDAFTGPGAALLDPWLAGTAEGRRFVSTGFDARRDGRIDEAAARHANSRFRLLADRDGDRRLSEEENRRGLTGAADGL